MRLTIKRRLSICLEVLTSRSGHAHPSDEKQLSLFQRGYVAGFKDGKPSDGEREQLWRNVERLIKENRKLREDYEKLCSDREGLLHTIETLREKPETEIL